MLELGARGSLPSLEMALYTLDRMALGGIRDHLGGGFHRYATDGRWFLPHFEKMLYDNALLLSAYSRAFGITGESRCARTAVEIVDWLEREMLVDGSAFAGSLDADSEGEEGLYYTWEIDEIERILGDPGAREFAAAYGATREGNYHDEATRSPTGRNVLFLRDHSGTDLSEMRSRLLQARLGQPAPGRDDKLVAGWNGLAVGALARASVDLSDTRCLKLALQAAQYLHDRMNSEHGLLRCRREGTSYTPAFLEDHAYLGEGMLDLYLAGGGDEWLARAEQIAHRIASDFIDPASGGCRMTGPRHGRLVAELFDVYDQATPSGGASAARFLARLAEPAGDRAWTDLSTRILSSMRALLKSNPEHCCTGVHALLAHLDTHL